MKTYTKHQSPTGYEIKFDFRSGRNLVVFTNFNPMWRLRFADNIEKVSGVKIVRSVIQYDNSMGSIVVLLNPGYDRETITTGIIEAFNKEFSE